VTHVREGVDAVSTAIFRSSRQGGGGTARVRAMFSRLWPIVGGVRAEGAGGLDHGARSISISVG